MARRQLAPADLMDRRADEDLAGPAGAGNDLPQPHQRWFDGSHMARSAMAAGTGEAAGGSISP
jgi:hypothetical protein